MKTGENFFNISPTHYSDPCYSVSKAPYVQSASRSFTCLSPFPVHRVEIALSAVCPPLTRLPARAADPS